MSERGFTSCNGLENNEDRSPDAYDYEMAAQYHARGQPSQPIIKTEEATDGETSTYPTAAPASVMNIELEIPGNMDHLPQKMRLDIPPSRLAATQGYVADDILLRELFGGTIAGSVDEID